MTATLFSDASWKVIAFGPAPNPHRPWSYEYGSAAKIAELCGTKIAWYNLFEHEPERWSREEARQSAEEWCLENQKLRARVPLLLLGTKVCEAFGIENIEWLQSYSSLLWYPMVAFPHPSGLNRWWNDPENGRRAGELATAIAQEKYWNWPKRKRETE